MRRILLFRLCIILLPAISAIACGPPEPQLVLKLRASAVALSPDGKLLAAAADKRIVTFDRASGKLLGEFGELPVSATALAFSPDGKLLAAAGVSGTRPGSFELRVWNVADKQVVYEFSEANHRDEGDGADAFAFLCFSPDGKLLVYPAKNRTVVVYDLPKRAVKHSFELGLMPSTVAFSRDGKSLAMGTDTGGTHGAVYHFDLETEKGLPTRSTLYSGVLGLAFSLDGKHLWGGHRDWLYRLDTASGDYHHISSEGSDWHTSALAFSPRADRVAVLNAKQLELRETKSGKILGHWPLAAGVLAWSSDGRAIVTGGEDGHVRVWDVAPATDGKHGP